MHVTCKASSTTTKSLTNARESLRQQLYFQARLTVYSLRWLIRGRTRSMSLSQGWLLIRWGRTTGLDVADSDTWTPAGIKRATRAHDCYVRCRAPFPLQESLMVVRCRPQRIRPPISLSCPAAWRPAWAQIAGVRPNASRGVNGTQGRQRKEPPQRDSLASGLLCTAVPTSQVGQRLGSALPKGTLY